MKAGMLTFFFTLAVASTVVMQAGAQQATVEVIPTSYTVLNVGLTFNVNVTIQSVENLYGYEFKLYYPNDILNGTDATQGSFLKTGGVLTFFTVASFADDYNASNGILNVLCTRVGSHVLGVNGSGTLVTVTFKSTSTNGPKALHLDDVKLSDSNLTAIPFTAVDGGVTVIPEFPVALVLPLLIVSTLVAITLGKRIRNHRGNFHSV